MKYSISASKATEAADMKRKTRDFGDFKKWKSYAVKHNYHKKTRGWIRDEDPSFYLTGWRNKWLDKIFPPVLKRPWNTFEEWRNYGVKNGLFELPYKKAKSRDWPYLKAGYDHVDRQNRKWITRVEFAPPLPGELENKIGPDEWLKECRQLGLDRLSRKEFSSRAPAELRDLAYTDINRSDQKRLGGTTYIGALIPMSGKIAWQKKGVDYWLRYGLERKYDKLTRKELEVKDQKYHTAGHNNKVAGTSTKWIDMLIPPKGTNHRSLTHILNTDEQVQQVLSLSAYPGHTGDVAELLQKLWPERFPSAAALARSLPSAVEHIGAAIKPFDFPAAQRFYTLMEGDGKKIDYTLEDVLYRILVDVYQPAFDKNPRETIKQITPYVTHPQLTKLASRVLSLYQSVYTFNVPGHGSLADRY